MDNDEIKEIGIDAFERIYVMPTNMAFPLIYREAMEVNWDKKQKVLHSPKPREWDHFKWFQQIHAAAKQQNCNLKITDRTKWENVPENTQQQIVEWFGGKNA